MTWRIGAISISLLFYVAAVMAVDRVAWRGSPEKMVASLDSCTLDWARCTYVNPAFVPDTVPGRVIHMWDVMEYGDKTDVSVPIQACLDMAHREPSGGICDLEDMEVLLGTNAVRHAIMIRAKVSLIGGK